MRKALKLEVNGRTLHLKVDTERTLLSLIHDGLDLTGTKYGCGEGQCGACTVLLNGEAVRSCLLPAHAARDSSVTTIEGLAPAGELHPLQQAFLDEDAMQCGYCVAGMILSSAALLKRNPHPDEETILHALQGNLCRCGAYHRILRAVKRASSGGDSSRKHVGA